MDYREAGVDITAADAAKARIKALARGTFNPSVLSEIGSFGGMFRPDLARYQEPVLVASTDGVGTKIQVARAAGVHDTVGYDLVAHCVNDILVQGALPLFFLDYIALGTMDPERVEAIVKGFVRGCAEFGCPLLGGETAEMPGIYRPAHFDLAGTIVGIVAIDKLPKVESVAAGDAIVGLPAVGLHTNGYSLARSLIPREEWSAPFGDATYADALLEEHPSYYEAVRAIQAVADVKAMAHITGGGLLENVARSLPDNVKAVFEQQRWSVPSILQELVRRGNLGAERYRIFNMGVGYTLVVPLTDAGPATEAVPGAKVVGWIENRANDEPRVIVHPAREG